MKTGWTLVLIISLFFCFFGCKGPGSDILPLEKMKVVFLHHLMVEETLNSYQRRDTAMNFDSAQSASYRKLLALHNIDSAVFYKSLAYYKSDIERFTRLIDSANAFGVREREKRYEMDAAAAEMKAEEESKALEDSLAAKSDSLAIKSDSLVNVADTSGN